MKALTTAKLIGWMVAAFIILMFLFSINPIVIIGAGERGVVFSNVTGIEDRVLGEGLHFRMPFVENVVPVSVRVQKTDVPAMAASKDQQTVNTHLAVNWHLDAGKVNKIYQQIGDETAVKDRIIIPATNEVMKAATAKKTANEILATREGLKKDVDTLMKQRLLSYNIIVDDVSIVNVEFSAEYNNAVEAKQVAQQEAERSRYLVEVATNEAESNRIKQSAITDQILQQKALDKWDGKLPQYWGGGALPFIKMGQ